MLAADSCLVGVITGPSPAGPPDDRGGVDGAEDRGLEPVRGNCFVWVRLRGWDKASDDAPEADGRGGEGT